MTLSLHNNHLNILFFFFLPPGALCFDSSIFDSFSSILDFSSSFFSFSSSASLLASSLFRLISSSLALFLSFYS
jgi:hypothetical protein